MKKSQMILLNNTDIDDRRGYNTPNSAFRVKPLNFGYTETSRKDSKEDSYTIDSVSDFSVQSNEMEYFP